MPSALRHVSHGLVTIPAGVLTAGVVAPRSSGETGGGANGSTRTRLSRVLHANTQQPYSPE